MEQPKEYYAFISYKREDKREARRLQHALEYYRLPNHLRQENPELPEYVRPVFRDMTDLEVGELSAQIHAGLEQSHFLIVVCSPRAAASKWVNDEVEYFISLGKQDKIIPYIIEGIPHASNPDEECYPPALLNLSKEKELLGANINEVGKDSATIRVVSRMFNIRFDTLYQRYEREQRRKRWMGIGGSMVIAFLGLSIGGYFVRQNSIIERQNERLQQDSITMANHLLQISAQNDSIALQNNLISSQRDSIVHSIQQLQLSNKLLAEERDNVLRANWKMMESQSRAVAEKSFELINNGDLYTARIIAAKVLPEFPFNKRPYMPIAEAAIRQAYQYDSGILGQHGFSPVSVNYSPDDKFIVSGSIGGDVIIWDSEKGCISQKLLSHTNTISKVLYSSDGKYVFSASWDGTLFLSNILTGEVKSRKVVDHINSASFSKKGDYISVSSDSLILILNVDGEIISQIKEQSYVIFNEGSISFSPNGEYILSVTGDKSIKIWNIHTGDLLTQLPIQNTYILSANWSPDGRYIVASNDEGEIQIWNFETKQLELKWKGHSDRINSVRYSKDGNLIVSASHDEKIKIWSNTGTIIATLNGHKGPVFDAIFDNSGQHVASGSGDYDVRVWGLIDNYKYRHTAFNKEELGMALFYGNSVVILSNNGLVRKWNYSTDNILILNNSTNSKRDLPRMALNKGKTILAKSSWDGSVSFVKPNNGEFLFSLFPKFVIYSIDFSPNGKYIAIGGDKGIEIWDLKKQKAIKSLNGHRKSVTSVSFSPDGKYLASTAFDGKVFLWDYQNELIIDTLKGYNGDQRSVSFSNNSKYLASTGYDGKTIVWDMATRNLVCTLKGHKSIVWSANFSPNDKQIVTASTDSSIIVWDIKSGTKLLTFRGHSERVNYASFSPDGKYIVSASDDGGVQLWSLPSLDTLIYRTNERFKNRQLTPEERRKYYLE